MFLVGGESAEGKVGRGGLLGGDCCDGYAFRGVERGEEVVRLTVSNQSQRNNSEDELGDAAAESDQVHDAHDVWFRSWSWVFLVIASEFERWNLAVCYRCSEDERMV